MTQPVKVLSVSDLNDAVAEAFPNAIWFGFEALLGLSSPKQSATFYNCGKTRLDEDSRARMKAFADSTLLFDELSPDEVLNWLIASGLVMPGSYMIVYDEYEACHDF